MIPSVEGLGQLIRLPYGCGEQTMLNFAPAIYITKYLSTVGKLTKEIQEKAIKSLKKGMYTKLKPVLFRLNYNYLKYWLKHACV